MAPRDKRLHVSQSVATRRKKCNPKKQKPNEILCSRPEIDRDYAIELMKRKRKLRTSTYDPAYIFSNYQNSMYLGGL